MKKRLLTMLTGVVTAVMLVGCGGKISNDIITINKYKGLEIEEVAAIKVTEEDIEESILSTLYTYKDTIGITEGTVKDGDTVILDFLGKVDDVAFEGGEGVDYMLEIGSNTFIPGFEDALIGHDVGETFDIDVTFPENYTSAELAGKDAVFTITLDCIMPELTDDIVKMISTTETTVEELRNREKANIESSNEETAKNEMIQDMWIELIANCVVDEFPEADMTAMMEQIEGTYSSYAEIYGMETEDYVQKAYGVTMKQMAEDLLKQQYAIDLIAEKEEIELTVADYEKHLKEYAEQWGYDAETMEELVGHEALEKMFIQDRVGTFLYENCKIK